MNLFEQLLLSVQALRHTVVQLFRPRLWLWVVPLALAQVAAITLIVCGVHPAVSWLIVPLLKRFGGESALHYPGTFETLPATFAAVEPVLFATLGAIGIGAATPAFAARFRGEPVAARAALAAAFRRTIDLVIVQLPLVLAIAAVAAASSAAGPGLRGRLVPFLGTAFTLAVQAATFYASCRVMLEGHGAIAALRSLPSTWRSGFVPALAVSLVTLAVLIPLQLPGVSVRLLVDRGRPELIAVMTLGRAAVGWLNAFLLTGAATLLYLGAVRPSERER